MELFKVNVGSYSSEMDDARNGELRGFENQDGNQSYTIITSSATSTDGSYLGMSVNDVVVIPVVKFVYIILLVDELWTVRFAIFNVGLNPDMLNLDPSNIATEVLSSLGNTLNTSTGSALILIVKSSL